VCLCVKVERLLRSIYMPQNVYCIHVDAKSPSHVHQAAAAIANCFDNVFIASRLESVRTSTVRPMSHLRFFRATLTRDSESRQSRIE